MPNRSTGNFDDDLGHQHTIIVSSITIRYLVPKSNVAIGSTIDVTN